MKLFFFFFLLLPCANALAVTPTSLDLTDGSIGTLYIYNTLDKEVHFEIDGLRQENFSLKGGESKEVKMEIKGERPGQYSGEIIVKELSEDGFVNAITIPVEYSGTLPQSTKTHSSTEMLSSAIVFVLLTVLFGGYVWKKRKKDV